jgi:hypothetical protein
MLVEPPPFILLYYIPLTASRFTFHVSAYGTHSGKKLVETILAIWPRVVMTLGRK